MTATSTIDAFSGAIEQQLGLSSATHDYAELRRLLLEGSRFEGVDVETYIARLASGHLPDEERRLAASLTVGETYFFRHLEQLSACLNLLLDRLPANAGQRTVRVLSAGCSTGEEPYSLAILLRESLATDIHVDIVGLDISETALKRARAAVYSAWSLRETAPHTVQRWFTRQGQAYKLCSSITSMVTFVQGNLAAVNPVRADSYDFILCRNVLMYFTPAQFRRAAACLVDALVPEGYLFLGHAESLRGMQLALDLVHARGSFHYRRQLRMPANDTDKSQGLEFSGPSIRGRKPPKSQEHARLKVSRPTLDNANVRAQRTKPDPSTLSKHISMLASVNDLLRQERFAEALIEFEAGPALSPPSPELELCRILLLVYNNRLDAAEALVGPLLQDERLAPSAHYARAMCHLSRSQMEHAAHHVRLTTYLDPTFAMAWFHLGVLSKQGGDLTSSRRALLQARALLSSEPPEHLLWFAGGCSRDSLLALCQRELAANGVLK